MTRRRSLVPGPIAVALGLGLALTPAVSAQTAEQEGEAAWPTWSASGQLRLRGAGDRDRRTAPDRERMRLRLRIGGEVALSQALRLGGRLTTSPNPDNPNSPYIDLGAGFDQARIAIDRLYAGWTPSLGGSRPLDVLVGKFPNPLLQPPDYGEIIWDADINPEGIAAIYEPVPELRLTGGGFLLLTQSNSSDVNMGTLQAATRLRPAEDWRVTAALGGYFYGDMDEIAARELAVRNRGNELIRDDDEVVAFASGFDIWQAHGALTYEGVGLPIAVSGEYITNASAASGFDGNGYGVGAWVGELRGAGTWAVNYRYQDVGQESVFSSLVQDDLLDATNFHGHIIGAAWQFVGFGRVRAWTLWSRRPGEDEFQRRFRIDVDFSWSMGG